MAFSFQCSMCSGRPLKVRGKTAWFSDDCFYCKPYAMVMWRYPRRECTREARLYHVCFWGIFEGGKELVSEAVRKLMSNKSIS
jgi:hypothetical protein